VDDQTKKLSEDSTAVEAQILAAKGQAADAQVCVGARARACNSFFRAD